MDTKISVFQEVYQALEYLIFARFQEPHGSRTMSTNSYKKKKMQKKEARFISID